MIITNILKNQNNSAILTFQSTSSGLTFNFSSNSFLQYNTLNLTIYNPDGTTIPTSYYVIYSGLNMVQVLINFNETIEGYEASATFNFNNTPYASQDDTLKFICKGSQFPLVVSLYLVEYSTMEKINLAFCILCIIEFLVGTLAPKYIGI